MGRHIDKHYRSRYGVNPMTPRHLNLFMRLRHLISFVKLGFKELIPIRFFYRLQKVIN